MNNDKEDGTVSLYLTIQVGQGGKYMVCETYVRRNPYIRSEVGRLTAVMMQEPGRELDRVTPIQLADVLIEDLLDKNRAQNEHDIFTSCLNRLGVDVLRPRQLLNELFSGHTVSRDTAKSLFEFETGNSSEVRDFWRNAPPEDLAEWLITGSQSSAPCDMLPLVNIMFTRDSFATIGDTIYIMNPKFPVRQRESSIMELIFRYHPYFKDYKCVSFKGGKWSIEGGDIVVVSDEIVLVGCGHRTQPEAVKRLAKELISNNGFKYVFRVSFVNPSRDKMHLDTVFTMLSSSSCLAYEPALYNNNKLAKIEVETAVERLELDGNDWKIRDYPTLFDGLNDVYTNLRVCRCGGGGDLTVQMREQWWDGANAFAVAENVIFSYDRCLATISELRENHGFDVIEACEVLSMPEEPTVILLPSNEISKARGGPRCLTMPITREGI